MKIIRGVIPDRLREYPARVYGAAFDGITDDATAIQTAINTASSAGGGLVILDGGTAIIGTTLTLASNVNIQGAGLGTTTLKLKDVTNVPVITGSIVSNVNLSDFTIDGNRANQTIDADGISLSGACTFITAQRIRITACEGNGFKANCTSGLRILVKDSYFDSNDLRGIHFLALARSSVVNCFCANNTLDGIDIDGFCQDILVQGNQCWSNTRTGIFVEEDCNDVTVTGNICNNNSGHGINVNEQTSGQITESITITGNVCEFNGDHGIRVAGNVSGATVRDVTITGNVCMENDQDAGTLAGIVAFAEIGAVCENIVITNNRCGDRQGTKTQDYGIWIRSLVTEVIVANNDVMDNQIAGILNDAGSNARLRDNTGYVTSNSGATSVADGGTITHGLAATPTKVRITPSVAAEIVSVTALGATTFTVAIKTTAGAAGTTQTIYWEAEI